MHIDSCLYQIISTIVTKLNRQFNQSKLIHKIQYIDFSIDSLLILSIKKIQENKLIFLLQSLIFLLHVYLLKVHDSFRSLYSAETFNKYGYREGNTSAKHDRG